jgi:hypothetical protein
MLFVSVWLLPVALAVSGATTCPTVPEVAAHIAQISSADTTLQFRLSNVPQGLAIELIDAAGASIERRVLPIGSACDENASAAALVITNLQASLMHDTSLAPQPTPPKPPAPPPPPPAPPIAATPTIVVAPPRPPHFVFELQADGSFVFAQTVTGGGMLQATFGSSAHLIAGQIAVFGMGFRTLPANAADWTRAGTLLGPVWRLPAGPFYLDFSPQLAIAGLVAHTNGLAANPTQRRADAALGGTIALRARDARVRFVIALTALGWLAGDDLSSGDLKAQLPRYDLFARAGIAWGTFR